MRDCTSAEPPSLTAGSELRVPEECMAAEEGVVTSTATPTAENPGKQTRSRKSA